MSQLKEDFIIIDRNPDYGAANQPSQFAKIDVNCWAKVFDYLSMRDIISMSETCQRMHQIGGLYFRKTFHGVMGDFSGSGPYIDSYALERQDFLHYVDTVQINGEMEDLQKFPYMDLCSSLTTLQLCFFCPTEQDAAGLGNIANDKIECIELYRCTVDCKLYEHLLKKCSKLKHLRIDNSYFEPTCGGINSIFRHPYPALERIQYTRSSEAPELDIFLVQNAGVKTIQIDADDFWTCRKSLDASNCGRRIDCLSIEIESMGMASSEFVKLLKTFYERGFYKKLHLSLYWLSADFDYQPFFNEIPSLGALQIFYTHIFNTNIAQLTQLSELHLMELDDKIDLKPLALNLIKLERLWIEGTAAHLLPFVCHSKELKTVIMELKDQNVPNDSCFDLVALDQERAKLQPTKKVLIGVAENVYLALKWKLGKQNLHLIEFARKETVCEHFDFKQRIVDYT